VNAWLVAARPPTLLASIAPVLVGSGLAAGQGVFRWDAFAVTLVTAVLLNVAVNFANDASDASRGVDTGDRIGPPRAVASGLLTARQVWRGTALVLAVACVGGIYLTVISGPLVLALGGAAIVALLAYTGGPWPYGYHGLGEVFVFLFFGLAAVSGSRYVHDATIPGESWLLAIPVGFLVTAILVANNIRDLETDRVAGKRTLAVMIGRWGSRALFAVLLLGAFLIVATLVVLDLLPDGSLITLLALPATIHPVRTVFRRVDGPGLIGALRVTAVINAVFGALLAVGLAL
jgi:1,4-dihydroxy-2-naphthoate octaprenyltransferase